MAEAYIPDRGDLVWTDFNPSSGHEQAGERPALVLSRRIFNQKVGLAMVVPVTSRERGHAFEVKIVNKDGINGVALCQQVKMIDYKSRGVVFAQKTDDQAVEDALVRIRAIVV